MTDLTPGELAAKIAKLPAWARKHIATREAYISTLETLTRTLHGQLTEARAAEIPVGWAAQAGLNPPSGNYATLRVYGPGDPGEPIADLPEGSVLLAAGFFTVRYGYPEKAVTATSARVLTVRGGGKLAARLTAPDEIMIERG